MITVKNYFDKTRGLDVKSLPGPLLKSHDFIIKITNSGNNWDGYQNNETIRRVIDLYLQKLNAYLASNDSDKNQEEAKNPRPKAQKEKVVKSYQEKSKLIKDIPSKKHIPPIKSGKKVEHIREEVKFIKRFISLHNKVKSPQAILSFIKSLQRAIVQKLIRKTSPLAEQVRFVQNNLVEAYNRMKGDTEFKINDKDLSKLVLIAGGEEVYPSIKIIKRYIGMQGNEADGDKVTSFIKHIDNVIKKEKVLQSDPYYDKVKTILNTLKNFKINTRLTMSKAELNGLDCIAQECSGRSRSSNNSPNGLSGVLSAEEMASRTFEKLNFDYRYSSLIGQPATNFTMMLHGEPNAGKTTFLLKFAKYLAECFGKVLYISSEEFSASTMTDKVNELLNPFPENLYFYANLNIDLSEYDFVILDSVNDLGLTLHDFKALRKDHPDTAFILILQHTKDGQYRGGKDWEHEVEIAGEVADGVVTIYRNRYGVKGSYNFFNSN